MSGSFSASPAASGFQGQVPRLRGHQVSVSQWRNFRSATISGMVISSSLSATVGTLKWTRSLGSRPRPRHLRQAHNGKAPIQGGGVSGSRRRSSSTSGLKAKPTTRRPMQVQDASEERRCQGRFQGDHDVLQRAQSAGLCRLWLGPYVA